ncbi:MAG: 4Fe-4S binding protein [Methanosarcinales archaeon]|nr:4Fe-4S binding protein [Methanosarcinales archaeon]
MNKDKDEPVHIFSSWCKKCGICISVCPKNVLERGPNGTPIATRPEDCIQCGLCDIHCPDFAITLSKKAKKEEEHEESKGSIAAG